MPSINPFCGQIAVSRARSFLIYPTDMPRHSLCGSLRFIPQNEFPEDIINLPKNERLAQISINRAFGAGIGKLPMPDYLGNSAYISAE
jgi:hypothetical protein